MPEPIEPTFTRFSRLRGWALPLSAWIMFFLAGFQIPWLLPGFSRYRTSYWVLLLVALLFWAWGRRRGARPAAVAPEPDPTVQRRPVLRGTLIVLAFLAQLSLLVTGPFSFRLTDPEGHGYYARPCSGFAAGSLSLPEAPPQALLALPDPWDPIANAPIRGSYNHDLVLYEGRFYVYWGLLPLVFYGPFRLIFGAFPSEPLTCLVFIFAAFLGGFSILARLKDRHFPHRPEWEFLLAVVAVALSLLTPPLLHRPAVYEIAILSATAAASWGLYALLRALEAPQARWWLACGLLFPATVLGRPNLAFAAILTVVGAGLWALRMGVPWKRLFPMAVAACLIVGTVATYNFARFGRPNEFGVGYQLVGNGRARSICLQNRFFYPSNLPEQASIQFLHPVLHAKDFPWIRPFHQVVMPKPALFDSDYHVGALQIWPGLWILLLLPALALRRSRSPAVPTRGFALAAGGFLVAAWFPLLCMPMVAYRYAGDVIGHAVLLGFIVYWMLMDEDLSPGWRQVASALFWSATVWGLFVAINLLNNPQPHTVFRPGFP